MASRSFESIGLSFWKCVIGITIRERRRPNSAAALSVVPALLPDLAVAEDDELAAGQLLEAHRAAGVELLRGDPHLGAEAVLEAVGEARRGVDDDRRGVDLGDEAQRPRVVLRDDGVGVHRAVARDVLHRLVQRVDDLDGEDQLEELLAEVLGLRGLHPRRELLRPRAAADLDAGLAVRREHLLEERRGDLLVHQQRLHRVADARALHLGVEADLDRHRDVGRLVDVDVADPLVVEDHRDRRALDDGADQLLAAARDDEVDHACRA